MTRAHYAAAHKGNCISREDAERASQTGRSALEEVVLCRAMTAARCPEGAAALQKRQVLNWSLC